MLCVSGCYDEPSVLHGGPTVSVRGSAECDNALPTLAEHLDRVHCLYPLHYFIVSRFYPLGSFYAGNVCFLKLECRSVERAPASLLL